MAATVHRPLKVVAFNAKATGRQAYGATKTHAESRNRRCPFLGDTSETTYEALQSKLSLYQYGRLDGNKGETAVAVKKGIPLTYVDLPPPLSLEATGVSIQIGHTEMLLASIHEFPFRAWRNADITELLNLKTKSIWQVIRKQSTLFGIVKLQILQV
jgi:hypothetical protein